MKHALTLCYSHAEFQPQYEHVAENLRVLLPLEHLLAGRVRSGANKAYDSGRIHGFGRVIERLTKVLALLKSLLHLWRIHFPILA